MNNMNKFWAGLGVFVALLVVWGFSELAINVGAEEIVVVQAPMSGNLTWKTTPGWMMQNFGTPTRYVQRTQDNFPITGIDKDGIPTGGIRIRFSDGGHGTMSGSVQFLMPTDEASLTLLNQRFHGQPAVDAFLHTVVANSVYLTGTLMTSKQSYNERKADLIYLVSDQIQHGTYRTHQVTTEMKDDATGQTKEMTTATILLDKDGNPQRQEDSVLDLLKIKVFAFNLKDMPYDPIIEAQINNQQKLAMQIQTSIAEMNTAQQRAITVEAEGRATAAQAKWEQEALKARAVTAAEQEKVVQETNAQRDFNVAQTQGTQRLKVADLDRQAAEQTKQKDILLGEGESKRRQLVMQADGALQQKLDAYVKVNQAYAASFTNARLVPTIVMGAAQGDGKSNPALDLINLANMNTLKALELKMDMQQQGQPK